MTSQPVTDVKPTHIANISRIKGNQTMKVSQLIEHPKTNIFL